MSYSQALDNSSLIWIVGLGQIYQYSLFSSNQREGGVVQWYGAFFYQVVGSVILLLIAIPRHVMCLVLHHEEHTNYGCFLKGGIYFKE